MRYASLNNPMILLGYATHPGKSGKNNEDDFVVFDVDPPSGDGTRSGRMPVALVADGIGGNIAGETASHLTAQTFQDTFRALHQSPPRRRLVEAIEAANLAVYERAQADSTLQGMGTTVVAATLLDNQLFVAHAGDSRAYLIRQGRAYQLTADHTWAQEAIEVGRLTPEQAREHPNRHVIKRFLGIAPEVEVDTQLVEQPTLTANPPATTPGRKPDGFLTQPGDTILLCSDGLTDVVSDKQIEQALKKYGANVQDAAHHLVDLANKAGGPDNITVLLLQRREGAAPAALVGSGSTRARSLWGWLVAAALVLLVGAASFLLWRNGDEPDAPAATTVAAAATVTPLTTPAVEAPTEPLTPAVTAASAATGANPAAPALALTPTLALSETVTERSLPTAVEVTATLSTTVGEIANESATRIAQNITDTTSLPTPPTLAVVALSPTATVVNATRPPTSTPVPELATDTPTPTPTPLPTRTATPRSAATVQTVTGGNADNAPRISVQLTDPVEGDTVNGSRVFRWNPSGALPSGFAFEPVFWQSDQTPEVSGGGWGGATVDSQLSIDLTKFPQVQPGSYKWGILLVEAAPYKRIGLISDVRTINLQRPNVSSDSGNKGSGPSSPSGGNND